jgi:hypothetical protein
VDGTKPIIAWQTVLIGAATKVLSLLPLLAISGRELIIATQHNILAVHITERQRDTAQF